MVKKIVIFIFVFTSVSYSQQLFKSDTYGFEITFPDKWEVKEDTATMITVIAEYGDYSSINIVVKENESIGNVSIDDVNLEKFKDDLVSKYKDAFTSLKEADYGKTTVNNIKAIYFTYNSVIADKVLRAKLYFMFNSSRMYVISTGCLESESVDYESVFNDCMNTFRFIN